MSDYAGQGPMVGEPGAGLPALGPGAAAATRALEQLRNTMREEEVLETVRAYARQGAWLAYHTRRSERSEEGFPDLVMVHPRWGRIMFVELKNRTRKVTPEQRTWLDCVDRVASLYAGCRECGGSSQMLRTRVWRPADLDEAYATLVEGAW